jgi:hypothetical protein
MHDSFISPQSQSEAEHYIYDFSHESELCPYFIRLKYPTYTAYIFGRIHDTTFDSQLKNFIDLQQ